MIGDIHMLKKLFVAVTLTSLSGAVFADESAGLPWGLSLSGAAAISTDYRFRGITQTDTDPAIQAGFSLTHPSGLYAGLWGSNVNFGVDTPHLELDPSFGYSRTLEMLSSKPIVDVGVLYYSYPSASELNWAELYAKLSFKNKLLEGDYLFTNLNYSNDYAGVGADSWNLNMAYSAPLASSGFSGLIGVGYSVVDEDKYSFNGDDHYLDWKAALSYSFKSVSGATAELAAIGTNLETKGLSDAAKRGVETGAVFTLSKAF